MLVDCTHTGRARGVTRKGTVLSHVEWRVPWRTTEHVWRVKRVCLCQTMVFGNKMSNSVSASLGDAHQS